MVLDGDDAYRAILTTALEGDERKSGTAEALFHNGNAELHVTVTTTEQPVQGKRGERTVVGVDVNKDNVALIAHSEDGVEDTVVIDSPQNRGTVAGSPLEELNMKPDN